MEINVVFSSDDKYVRHIFVSMNSLFESNKDKQMLNVYLVDNKISQQNKKILIELAKKYNRKLKFLPFSSIKDDLEGVSPWANSLSPYARLFLARYIDKDKVLYVDGDTAIVGDLEPLFEIDIDNYYLGAVQDTAGPVYREAVGITNNEIYFNSGVTIINLKKWREDKMEQKFIKCIEEFNGNVPCADQGTLNKVCKGKIFRLAPTYNLMTPMLSFQADEIKTFFEIPEYYSEEELKNARENPVIIHYVGGFYVRPWYENSDHPKRQYYQFYMKQSPWRNQYIKGGKLGLRTELMKWSYRHFSFRGFIFLHRSIRKIKRLLTKK